MKINDYKTNTLTNWQILPLRNIIKEVKLKNNSKENITVFAITKHSGLVPSLKFFKKKVFSIDLRNYKIIEKGQFAYSPIHLNEGAIGLLETHQQGLVSPLHIVFKILPNLHSSFFILLFKTNRFISTCSRFAQGSVHRRGAVSFRDFSNIHVSVPPLVEQLGIIEVIGTVDECIRLTDAVIEKAEELKRGLMQQLLTRGIGHTEYKETLLGEIPKGWKIVKLRELVTFKNGIYKPAEFYGEGPPSIRMYNIVDEKIVKKGAPLLNVTDKEREKFGLSPGDLVINRVNTRDLVGKTGIVDETLGPATFESKNIRLRVKNNLILPNFVNLIINTKRTQYEIRRNAKAAIGQATITQNDLEKILIQTPSLEEQSNIVDIISSVKEEINNNRSKKNMLNLLKQGLMQQLLSGKIRVELKGDELHRIGNGREANN